MGPRHARITMAASIWGSEVAWSLELMQREEIIDTHIASNRKVEYESGQDDRRPGTIRHVADELYIAQVCRNISAIWKGGEDKEKIESVEAKGYI